MIESLKRISELDGELLKLRKWLAPHRARRDTTAALLTAARAEVDAAARAKTDIEKTIRSYEVDLASIEEKKKKEAKKLEAVTSVKAARAAEHELEALAAMQAEIEEKMLEQMERLEEAETAKAAAEKKRAETETECTEAGALFDEGAANVAAKEAAINAQKATLFTELKPEIHKKYLALSSSGIEQAIVVCTEAVCAGCNAKIKPNILSHLKAQQPAQCDQCRRILVF